MPITIDQIIDGIIKRESPAYTNDPSDAGGPTKFGITLRTLRNYRNNQKLQAIDVQNLTEKEAREIYEHEYLVKPGFSQLRYGQLYVAAVDFGVTSGPDDSIKVLQKVLGVKQDGVLGPQTANAANIRDGRSLCNAFCVGRAIFYANEVQRRPANIKYVEGWIARALSFVV